MSGEWQVAGSGVKFAPLWRCCAESVEMICCDCAAGYPLSMCTSLSPWSEQTATSRSSAESEIVSLDAGLRMDGLPSLQFGKCVLATIQ